MIAHLMGEPQLRFLRLSKMGEWRVFSLAYWYEPTREQCKYKPYLATSSSEVLLMQKTHHRVCQNHYNYTPNVGAGSCSLSGHGFPCFNSLSACNYRTLCEATSSKNILPHRKDALKLEFQVSGYALRLGYKLLFNFAFQVGGWYIYSFFSAWYRTNTIFGFALTVLIKTYRSIDCARFFSEKLWKCLSYFLATHVDHKHSNLRFMFPWNTVEIGI